MRKAYDDFVCSGVFMVVLIFVKRYRTGAFAGAEHASPERMAVPDGCFAKMSFLKKTACMLEMMMSRRL
jgi:hypothetical protein